MSALVLTVGMTCHIGKGKTKWEVIKINDSTHTVELSALGKGGYSNRSANVDDLSLLEPQAVITSLGQVIEARAKARAAAANLNDRLRFNDTSTIRRAINAATSTSWHYVNCVTEHNGDLAILGIKAE